MRLIHKNFGFSFEFEENSRNILVIEQSILFLKMVQELFSVCSEEESGFVLSENNMPINIKDSLVCVINPLAITLNERKLLSKLSELLKKEILSSDLLLENNQIIASLENYALHIIQSTDWELTYSNQIDFQSLLKLIGIQFCNTQETLVEKITDYVKVMHELLDIKCFVFVHLLSYLTDYELEKLYEYLNYQKIHMLLIESQQPEKIERFSKFVIIDKDACEIMLDV